MNHKQLLFSSGGPYVTQWGNTLSWPEKQHWFVNINFFSGWISRKKQNISTSLSGGFCISRKKKRFVKALVDFCFTLWCKTPHCASVPIDGVAREVCWQRAHWSLLFNSDPYFVYSILLSQCHLMFPGNEDKTLVPSLKCSPLFFFPLRLQETSRGLVK